ncbi:MAG: multidrug ABC transporter ATP-binding protein [Planctomycetaceae bacterium]|nr:multidrug ABC transporter ATP-binding protein [Planctomycetaceae bacterium]
MLIATEALSKHYGVVAALDDFSFAVERGEILGLLGPNGAGKTTLLRLLLGYLKPTAGRARIDGLDCYRQSVEVHRRLTYLPGEARFTRRLTGRDTLEFLAALRQESSVERAVKIADRLQLDLSRRVGEMSTGMRQKLGLAAALAPDVPLLVLDEPTENLDPTVRGDVLELVRESRAAGRTVLFSSHVLSEVEESCDRAVLLKDGRLVDSVRVSEVRRQHRIRARLTGPLQPAPPELATGLKVTELPSGETQILTPGDLAPLLGWLSQQPLAELQIEPVGLRTVYARHHGQEGGA